MKNYSQDYRTKNPHTPTNEAQPGREAEMVVNNAGGMTFAITPMQRVERFLILGTESGTYYQKAQAITRENAKTAHDLIKAGHGHEIVDLVVDVSTKGRAPKNDPAIYLLAMVAGLGTGMEKKYALDSIPLVCRTGTHLFQFVEMVQGFRGWGRGLRDAVANWYANKGLGGSVYQTIKYQQRNGWTHRDILRKCHADNDKLRPLFEAITQPDRYNETSQEWADDHPMGQYDAAMRTLRVEAGDKEGIKRALVDIADFGLPHECIPGHMKKMPETWSMLVETNSLPYTACLRNLGAMTANGAIAPLSNTSKKVIEILADFERLKKARVHPLSILVAAKIYGQGHGMKGKLAWNPEQRIMDVLDRAFYAAFKTITPTGKNFLLGLDVSGSMTWTSSGVAGGLLTASEGAAVMALATANAEQNYYIKGFSDRFVDLPISPGQRLADVCRVTYNMTFGRTDCALPMVFAEKNQIPVDVFCVYTDNETWFDSHKGHPSEALVRYRDKMGIGAKLIVIGMTSTGFTIADPNDSGMLDLVGFDTNCPALISEFATQ